MTRDPLASGDLIAERRFAYAKAAAEDGDWSAAAELFEQTLEQAPHWAAAWFALGEAREKLGDLDAAARAFRETLAADPADAQGAAAALRSLGGGTRPVRCRRLMSRGCSTTMRRASTSISIKNLGYRAPALIADGLERGCVGPALRLGPRPRLRHRPHGRSAARVASTIWPGSTSRRP